MAGKKKKKSSSKVSVTSGKSKSPDVQAGTSTAQGSDEPEMIDGDIQINFGYLKDVEGYTLSDSDTSTEQPVFSTSLSTFTGSKPVFTGFHTGSPAFIGTTPVTGPQTGLHAFTGSLPVTGSHTSPPTFTGNLPVSTGLHTGLHAFTGPAPVTGSHTGSHDFTGPTPVTSSHTSFHAFTGSMPVSTGSHTSFHVPTSSSIPVFQHGFHGSAPNYYNRALPVYTGQPPVIHSTPAIYDLPGYMQKQSDNSEKIDRLVEQMAKVQNLLSEVICALAGDKASSTEMEDRRKSLHDNVRQAMTWGDDSLRQQILELRRELEELKFHRGTVPKPLPNQPVGLGNLQSVPVRFDVPPPNLSVRKPPYVGNKLCYRCGAPGHFIRECPMPASYDRRGGNIYAPSGLHTSTATNL